MQRLPLFPLGAVLVPGLVMPLRVFESRYLALMEHLSTLEPDERLFGVVAIRAGHEVGTDAARQVFDVGCTAVLRQVSEQADGTLQVLVSGGGVWTRSSPCWPASTCSSRSSARCPRTAVSTSVPGQA